jgi:broad specificity phosphatase PhoE
MTRYLFVRHAVTAENIAYQFVGQRCNPPLHDIGIAQADALGVAIRDVPLTQLITSPLTRAAQTAAAIARWHRSPLIVQVDARLAEIDLGHLDGKSTFTAYKRDPALIDVALDAQVDDFAFPGGERRSQAVERLSHFFQEGIPIPAIDATATVCIVTHGAMIGLWRAYLEHQPLGAFRRWQPSHASLSSVHRSEGRDGEWHVESWNEVGHLPLELSARIQALRDVRP